MSEIVEMVNCPDCGMHLGNTNSCVRCRAFLYEHRAVHAEERVADLQKQVQSLRKALEPFAKVAEEGVAPIDVTYVKPCPLCSSTNVQLNGWAPSFGHCRECGATGPVRIGRHQARVEWNTCHLSPEDAERAAKALAVKCPNVIGEIITGEEPVIFLGDQSLFYTKDTYKPPEYWRDSTAIPLYQHFIGDAKTVLRAIGFDIE